jgi:ATP-binding cassette, subfamily B, bacterial
VKSFSLEQRAIAAFEQTLGQLFRSTMRLIGIGAILVGSTEIIALGIRVVTLAIGAVLIMNDRMSIGELVAFIGLIGEVLTPVTAISEQYQQLQAATGALDRIEELTSEPPDIVEDPLAVELPPVQREIRLDGVSFRYDDGEGGLRDVSLTIPAGARVAVVGPSGAGKSTLAALLLRHYDPSHGQILFDGRDIREGTFASVRGQLAVVPQETYLFDTSIAENIALGREGAGEADVVRAAEAAALTAVIERTEAGYDTLVGERGVRLSGGQRQRLAIARALIRDPSVLILDEATSALDAETEGAILKTVDEVSQGRTTIMITHRLSSAVQADRIFVLDQGELVEQGTHEELSQQRGLYWRLYSEQQAGVIEALNLPVAPRRLARVPLLASLSPAELAVISLRLTVERYPAGAVIVREGEPADKLYVLVDGQAEVLAQTAKGEQRRLAVLDAHSYFGEIALLGDEDARRTATVRSLTPTELYSLHREDFLGLLRSQPTLSQEVAALAHERLEQTRHILALASVPPAGATRSATLPPPGAAPSRPDDSGTPAPRAILTVREGPDAGRNYVLDGRVTTLGRGTDSHICLPDNTVSRRHCQVYWGERAYVVQDLGSSNGTYLNGERVEASFLRSGDTIQIGDQVLVITIGH